MAYDGRSDFYRGKRSLVPGGAGFIGSNLARRLAVAGAAVTIVDPFNEYCGANRANIDGIPGKVTLIRDRIEDFLAGADIRSYDVIFNCIGLTNHHIGYENPALDYDINCLSALRMLSGLAASKSAARLISIGTRNQYGKSVSAALDESSPMSPLDVQAIHKVTLESYHGVFASRFGLDLVFARLTNTYGPAQRLRGDGIGVAGEAIRAALTGKEVTVYGSEERVKDFVFVDDAVDALLRLGSLPAKKGLEVFNVGGQAVRMGELVDALKAKLPVKVKVVPFPEKIKKMDTGDTVLDTRKVRGACGWEPKTGITEGMAKTIDYYTRHRQEYI